MFGYIRIIRVYGMEGGAAEEGEAKTRIIESSYRRQRYSLIGRHGTMAGCLAFEHLQIGYVGNHNFSGSSFIDSSSEP